MVQLYGVFLSQLFHKLGCEMAIENVVDGALVFYKTVADFAKFHQAADLISPLKHPLATTPRNKNDHVELHVEAIRLPPNVTVDDMITKVAKSYETLSESIKVEKLSESSAVIHYYSASTIEKIFEYLKELWDQNRGDASQNVPKREEVADLSHNIPL